MPDKGWIVPTDWDGVSYKSIMMCVPDSLEWQSLVTGAIYLLTRRYEYTGTQEQKDFATATGLEILDMIVTGKHIIMLL